jgi:vacuolar protein-sorting-associated protein 4
MSVSEYFYLFYCSERLSDEKNEKSKVLIRQKIEEYLARAETLKSHMQQNEDGRARRAIGANGMANGGTGGKGNKYVFKPCCKLE